jgi:hypothetical protein
LLTSIAIVAGCAALARLPVVAQSRYKGSPEPSYVPAVVAAFVGGTIVLLYGIVATKRATAATGARNTNNDQPQSPTAADQPGG